MHSFEFTTQEAANTSILRSRRRCKSVPLKFVFAILLVLLLLLVHRKTTEGGTQQQSPTTPLEEEDVGGLSTNVPTEEQPETPSSSDMSCDILYACQTDRLGHEMPLSAGQALCNAQYRFGLTQEGALQWHDCDTEEKKIVHDPSKNTTVLSFVMSETGRLRLVGEGREVIWQKEPTLKIVPTKECLQRPLLDCPYLHLHKSGDVVLNSIDPNTKQWSDRKIQKCFDDFFH